MLLWPPKPVPGNAEKLAVQMDGLAAAIVAAAPAANVYAWPVESITTPCVVIGFPTRWDYDLTYSRGADTSVYPVWFVVGKSSTIQGRNALSDIMTGDASVKAILDGDHDFGDVRVQTAEVTELTVSGVAYLAAKFDCEVIG